MMFWRKFAISMLIMMSGALALAQDQEQIPSPPLQEAESMEVAPSAPHVNNYGVVIPAGWNMALAIDALGVYDSNPAFQLQPAGDAAQRYSGNLSLSYLAEHTIYLASYIPSFTYYRQFTSLNSADQSFDQTVWHDVSPHTSFGWRLEANKYPSWGGSAFANSSFGPLLMELSGLTALNLESKVSNASTGFTVEHKLSGHSHIQADISGGATKYVHSDSGQFVSLLTAPDSSTWAGQMSLLYDYQLSSHRTLGVGVSGSYFVFTTQNYHVMTESAVLRYSEVLRDGWAYTASVGPQFIEEQLSSQPLQPGLSLDFGLIHKTRKSSFRASVGNSYQIGQAQGNLTSWTGLVTFEHAIGKRYFAGGFGSYLRSDSPVTTGSLGTGVTQSFAPAVDGGVRLTRHLVWFTNYGFSVQQGVLTEQKNIYRQQFVSGLSLNVERLFFGGSEQ